MQVIAVAASSREQQLHRTRFSESTALSPLPLAAALPLPLLQWSLSHGVDNIDVPSMVIHLVSNHLVSIL